ncbi:MAG: PilZ domain-containing protein [Deltaproteobacteria bacterium]|nr:PilZ domain-containing protein [Deltaproteobacteria bacterium]
MRLNIVDRRQNKRSRYIPNTGRRTFPRYDAPVDCIYISDSQTFTTRFINLSLRGIYIDTRTPDAPGTKVRIRLILPDSEMPLDIEGEVIWATNNSMVSPVKVRGMGIKFTNMDDYSRRKIAAYLLSRAGISAFPKIKSKYFNFMD